MVPVIDCFAANPFSSTGKAGRAYCHSKLSIVMRDKVARAMLATLALLPAAAFAQDPALGASIAAKGSAGGAAACVSCHGAKGEGNAAAGFPRLAGLNPAYLEAQLASFAAGRRQSPIMAPIAKSLTEPERKAVSAYFGGLPAAPGVAPPAEADLKASDTGPWLVLRGRWEEDLPACVQCHGAGGTGVGTAFPALAGQPASYIAAQLHAFKNQARPGGPLNLMAIVAKKLSDGDITAVADYFSAARVSASQTAPAQRKK